MTTPRSSRSRSSSTQRKADVPARGALASTLGLPAPTPASWRSGSSFRAGSERRPNRARPGHRAGHRKSAPACCRRPRDKRRTGSELRPAGPRTHPRRDAGSSAAGGGAAGPLLQLAPRELPQRRRGRSRGAAQAATQKSARNVIGVAFGRASRGRDLAQAIHPRQRPSAWPEPRRASGPPATAPPRALLIQSHPGRSSSSARLRTISACSSLLVRKSNPARPGRTNEMSELRQVR